MIQEGTYTIQRGESNIYIEKKQKGIYIQYDIPHRERKEYTMVIRVIHTIREE